MRRGKAGKLEEFIRDRSLEAITGEIWQELARLLAPISESYLRRLVQATGLPVEQPYEGVRQHSFEELEGSLARMGEEYARAVAAGDAARAQLCRRVVIQSKDHARMVSRNEKVDADVRKQKEEMVEWMLVWLENPGIFETWAGLRRQGGTMKI